MKLVFIFCFTFLSLFLFGERTDIVILLNGDKITGEIKELKQGKLKFKTDDISTIYIEWEQIDNISSDHNFELITVSGGKYFGSISFSKSRKLKLISPAGFYEMFLFEIITIIPIKNNFWKRLDGNINFGLNYTKASDLTQGNVDFNLYYNTHKFQQGFSYSNLITIQTDKDDAIRQNANYNIVKLLDKKWLWQSGVNWQQNSELGILSRASVYGQYGKFLIFNSVSSLRVSTGLYLNSETSLENETNQNAEASVSANYEFFSFDTPKLTITSYYTVYPSLTIKGRVRQDFSTDINWKIFSDFTISFSVYLNTDSKPITENASNNDYGVITSVGYTF